MLRLRVPSGSSIHVIALDNGEFGVSVKAIDTPETPKMIEPTTTLRIADHQTIHQLDPGPGSLPGLSLAGALEQWGDFRRHNDGHQADTIKRSKDHVRIAFEECGWRAIDEISAGGYREYTDSLMYQRRSPRTRKNHKGSLSQFCKWLVKEGHLESDPLADFRIKERASSVGKGSRAMTFEETRDVIRYAMWVPLPHASLERAALVLLPVPVLHRAPARRVLRAAPDRPEEAARVCDVGLCGHEARDDHGPRISCRNRARPRRW